MSVYRNFSKISLKKLIESRLPNGNVSTNVNHINCEKKLWYVPRRLLRGVTRTYEILPNNEENDESSRYDKNFPRLSPESSGLGIKKRKIKDLLDNSVTDLEFSNEESRKDVWSKDPYPKPYHKVREIPKLDPRHNSILLFPGQGSQYVGMGEKLLNYPNVEKMYEVASNIVGYDLLNLSLYGPKEDLDKTIHCQPAVVVASLAAIEKLKDESPHIIDTVVGAAGFSVGEITALIFAKVLTFQDGIKLTRIRAEAMQAASEMESGGMLTVFFGADARIGFGCTAAIEWCKRKGIEDPECVIANHLCPGIKVIAGHEEAIKFLMLNAKDFGIRRYKQLPVSGAFHTRLMLPAEESVKIAMKTITLRDPVVCVYSNASGKVYSDANHIRRKLHKQISSPVKWEQILHTIYERPSDTHYPRTFECGPGKNLSAILEKVNGKAFDLMNTVEA